MNMRHVPMHVANNWTGSVRGEIMLFKRDKTEFFPDAKNCRNMASGIAKRIDGSDCDKLTIVCYDARSENASFEHETDVIEFLQENGFYVVNCVKFDTLTYVDAMKLLNETFNEHLNDIPYDIDGLVFKTNVIDYDDQMTNVRPKTNIALKPNRIEATFRIIDIEWSLANGTYTPVAIIEPVELDGPIIQRASLSNVKLMLDMNVEIGKRCIITRRGMIIPHIERMID